MLLPLFFLLKQCTCIFSYFVFIAFLIYLCLCHFRTWNLIPCWNHEKIHLQKTACYIGSFRHGGWNCKISKMCIVTWMSPRIQSLNYQKNCTANLQFHESSSGYTPLKAVPILSCLKAWSNNRDFRVIIMISIGPIHVCLNILHSYASDRGPFCGWWLARFFADWARRLRLHFASFWLSVVLYCL